MNKRNILCKPENLFPMRGRMPIFCLGYAQIRTPFGEKSHNGTLVSNTAILHKIVRHKRLGKTSAKEFGKYIRLETLTRKAVSRAQNRLCANPKHTAVFREVRTAQCAWDGAVFSLKVRQKRGYFYEVRTWSLYNPHDFWV